MVISTPVEILLETLEEENRNPPNINLPMSFPSSSRSAGSIITIEEESDESFDEVDLNGPDAQSVFTRKAMDAEVQTVISMFDEDGPLATWSDEAVSSDAESNVDLFIALTPRSKLIKCLFDIMYYTGFSPVSGNGQTGTIIQFVVFILFTIFCFCEAMSSLKRYMLSDIAGGIILHYVRVLLYSTGLIIRAIFLRILKSKDLAEYLETNWKDYNQIPVTEQKTLSKAGIVISLVDAIMAAIFGLDIYLLVVHGWSQRNVFLWQSVHVGRMLFQWRRSNDTEIEELMWDRYGTDITITSGTMATFGASYRIIGYLQKSFIHDILLALSLYVLAMATTFLTLLKDNKGRIDAQIITKMWKSYHYVYNQCVRINNVFSFLINLAHVDNLFFLASAMLSLVNSQLDRIDFFDFSWRIFKIIITYGANVATSYITENFKFWINIETEKAEEVAGYSQAIKIIRINQRIQVTPIGLGNGTYRITESFVNKLLGLAVSLFMLFAKPIPDI